MFAFIRGALIEASSTFLIVETHGIGYRIFTSGNTLKHIPQLGEAILVHTSFIVRELSQTLYGFIFAQERDLFEALLEINGIGPKLALSFVGHMTIPELQKAVAQDDVRTLCKVPGIGKKTAERLLIDLRDKIANLMPIDPSGYFVQAPPDSRTQMIRDAMSALINLGYTQTVAQKAIKKTMQEMPGEDKIELPQLITNALKNV